MPHRARAARERARLAEPRRAAVAGPDHGVVHAHPPQQRDVLRVVARRHLHLVPRFAEEADDRAEDDRVRGRRHVDPDPQGSGA
jgi:hypothetical protein